MTRARPSVVRFAARLATLVAAVSAAALPASLQAHHAWNEVDTARTITVAGTVRSLKWENPHASLVLAASVDGGPPVEWTVLMSGLARMEARGIDAAAVAVGRTLTIAGSPARDAAHVMRANRITAAGTEHVLY